MDYLNLFRHLNRPSHPPHLLEKSDKKNRRCQRVDIVNFFCPIFPDFKTARTAVWFFLRSLRVLYSSPKYLTPCFGVHMAVLRTSDLQRRFYRIQKMLVHTHLLVLNCRHKITFSQVESKGIFWRGASRLRAKKDSTLLGRK